MIGFCPRGCSRSEEGFSSASCRRSWRSPSRSAPATATPVTTNPVLVRARAWQRDYHHRVAKLKGAAGQDEKVSRWDGKGWGK